MNESRLLLKVKMIIFVFSNDNKDNRNPLFIKTLSIKVRLSTYRQCLCLNSKLK